jgi:hypothetical protein
MSRKIDLAVAFRFATLLFVFVVAVTAVSAASKKVVKVWFTDTERHNERVVVGDNASAKLVSVQSGCAGSSCLTPGVTIQCDPNCGSYGLVKIGEEVAFPKGGNLVIWASGTAPVTADVEIIGAKN